MGTKVVKIIEKTKSFPEKHTKRFVIQKKKTNFAVEDIFIS